MYKKDITILIPVHKIDGDYKEMLINALSSVEDFHNDVVVSIICPTSIKNEIGKLSDKLGLEKCDTTWFTILEMDDEFKPSWLKSVNEYTKEYTDVDVFLPIVKDVNVEGKFLSFTNESTWAYGFVEKQGFLDNETLLEFQNYQTSGGLFKTQVIKDNGGLKENIKLTFSYELLLRLTHNGVKIMSIPRIGYQHVNFREDSLFWSYKNDDTLKLEEPEVKFWLDTAKKEFFFKNKRDVKYKQV